MRSRIQVRVVEEKKRTEFEIAVNDAIEEGWYIHWKTFKVEPLYAILISRTIGGPNVTDKN